MLDPDLELPPGGEQPRERAVPCPACGARMISGVPVPNVLTMNPSGLCDRHERAVLAERARRRRERAGLSDVTRRRGDR